MPAEKTKSATVTYVYYRQAAYPAKTSETWGEQEKACMALAEKNGLTIGKVYSDLGAGKLGNTGFNSMLANLAGHALANEDAEKAQ